MGRSAPYFQDLRVERAVYLLRSSKLGVDQIAQDVGCAEGVTLRAAAPAPWAWRTHVARSGQLKATRAPAALFTVYAP